MALTNKPKAAETNTAQFEDESAEGATDMAGTAESASTAAAAPATTAVATQTANSRALSSASAVVSKNVLSGMKDAFRVEFDSLPAIAANQGSFAFKDTEQELGASIVLQLMSYQDSYVASPNDTKADIELVKYSEDGVTAKDGTNLLAHVADLKEQGYTKAKLSHRCVLVGELISSSVEGVERVGELVQIDMPESGRRGFNTATLQASYAVAKGRKTVEEASILTLKAVKETTKSGEKFTKIVFA